MPLIPIVLILASLACLVATAVVLRSLGSRYRVGRLLSATPERSIDAARAHAHEGARVYVRVTGRISSDEEFPDENDRPLVYRRKRLQAATGDGQWRTVSEEREAVAFGVEARSSFIAVDEAVIEAGLVAIPREASGRLGDLPTAVSADLADGLQGLAGDAPARLVVEQLSAVEHATVCGVPVLRDGEPAMTAGLGRPLIVTTLAVPDAMRLLAAPHRRRVQAAACLLALAFLSFLAALVALATGL